MRLRTLGLVLAGTLAILLAPSAAAAADGVPQPPRPLILIPGTTGSYLGSDADGLLWLDATRLYNSASDDFLDELQLRPDGSDYYTDPFFQVRILHDYGIDGVVGAVQGCGGPFGKFCKHVRDEYNITVDLLGDHNYVYHDPAAETADQTLFMFAYDWRKGMIFNGERLRSKIKHVLAVTGADSVDILAHSQGGVVTNLYLHAWGQEHDVHSVVTLGTPYLGTPKFLGILEFKEPCQVVYNGACIVNRAEVAQLVRNWPGSLELLPSARYWELAASPLVERVRFADGSSTRQVEPYEGVLSRLAASHQNMTLINQAGNLHSVMDVFPADSTPILRMAGVGLPTINRIEEEAFRDCIRIPNGFQTFVACRWRTRVKNHFASGDGTVVKQSAEVENCRTGKSLDTSVFGHVAQRLFVGHDELTHDATTIAQAVRFFRTGDAPPAPCPSAPTLRRTADVADDDPGLAGTVLRTTGALTGSISDGTEETGTVESNLAVIGIDGSTFSATDDSADYATTVDASLTGSFTAAADGQVGVQLNTYSGDDVSQLAVSPPISVTQGAIVSVVYAQPQDLSLLSLTVDDNGDGVADRTIPFEQPVQGVALGDSTPPTSTVTVDHFVDASGNKLVRVTVSAADEGGSGVGEIHWWTTTGREGTYTEPFVLPAQGDIEVVATDRAGNVQVDPSWGVLDDHTGVNFLVTDFSPPHFNVSGFMDYPGDVDYWGVHVDGGRVKFQLVGLTFDGNLELDNLDGSAIAASTQTGNRSEKIVATLPAGNYLLRVTGNGAAYSNDHPYRLNVNALGGP